MNVSGIVSLGGAALNLLTGGQSALVVGGITLAKFNAPNTAPYGNKQTIVRHELPGGVLILDALGAFQRNFEVSGVLMGGQAVATARKLDKLVKAGKAVDVTWKDFNLRVLFESLEADYQRLGWEGPYKLVGHVVPVGDPKAPKLGIIQQFLKDTSDALGLSSLEPALSEVTEYAQEAQKYVPLLGAISPSLAAKAGGFLAAGTSAATGLRSVTEGNFGGFNLVASGVGGFMSTNAATLNSVSGSSKTAATAATAAAYLARSQRTVAAAVNN